MLLSKPLENLGDIRGIVYDFEFANDVLPKHNHNEDDAHITIVARGRIKAYSHDWEQEYSTGQVIDFPAYEPHELMALEDNTRVVNITKKAPRPQNMWPNYVANLPEEIRSAGRPDIKLLSVSNVYTRLMHFKNAGDIEHGHKHTYDHATLISVGSVRIDVLNADGEVETSKDFVAPTMAYIPKDKIHRLTSLVPNTVCSCIHALRTIDSELVDPDFLVEPLESHGMGEIRNAVMAHYSKDMQPLLAPF